MANEPTCRDRLAFRMDDAAKASGICKSKLYMEIRDGKLRSIKRAGRRLILRDDLEAYLRGTEARAA